MFKTKINLKLVTISIALFLSNTAMSKDSIKLYTLNCGAIHLSDMEVLSDSGKYNGQSIEMVNPCFLIQHPKGILLWEAGHHDNLADVSGGEASGVWRSTMETTLEEQLSQLGLAFGDIDYLSVSHIHPDHSGNSNKFSSSKFIINESEKEYMYSKPIKAMFGAYYSDLIEENIITFEESYDVFNDGSVTSIKMPGHTPGSSVLLIKLPNSGNILITGDLYIHAKGRTYGTMHQYNFDKQQTKDSRKKFEALVIKENARVLIHHDKQDFNSMPKFPDYLN